MSERPAALVLLIALCASGAASGQVPDTNRLHHRADSLLALWRQANTLGEAQQAARDARHQRAAQVTRATATIRGENPVNSGGLMVIADYPDSIPLREATRRAWAILSNTYGSRAIPLVERPIHLAVMFSKRQRIAAPNARHVPRNVSVDELERTLLGMTGVPSIDRHLSGWLGNVVEPVFDTAASRSNVYVQLVTAGSISARRCFEGNVTGCAMALQIPEDTEFFLTAFDADERRHAVAAARSRAMVDPAVLPTYTHCVDDRVDSACVTFLRALGQAQIPRPLGFEARNLLVSTALAMGGSGAFERLTADSTAAVADRLARAANAPVERVVATWRSDVIAARPAPIRVSMREALLAIGWVGLFAVGAIRSTRWRLA